MVITSPYDPAAVGNQDTTAAVFSGSGPDLPGISTPTTTAQTGLEPPPQRGRRLATSWSAATGLVKSWMAISIGKIAPEASWLAATELVKCTGGHLHRKDAPAASWLAATGLVTCMGRLPQAG